MQGHHHELVHPDWLNIPNGDEDDGGWGVDFIWRAQSAMGILGPTNDGVNGPPRVDAETRPFNAGVRYCIKY